MHTIARTTTAASFIVLSTLNLAWAGQPQTGATDTRECEAYSQAQRRDCLARKSEASAIALQRAEQRAVDALSSWDEEAENVAQAKMKLKAANRVFSQYREAQCGFISSLGGGAVGGALAMRKFTCVIELNTRRADELAHSVGDLPKR